jgi:hypothetical protein
MMLNVAVGGTEAVVSRPTGLNVTPAHSSSIGIAACHVEPVAMQLSPQAAAAISGRRDARPGQRPSLDADLEAHAGVGEDHPMA